MTVTMSAICMYVWESYFSYINHIDTSKTTLISKNNTIYVFIISITMLRAYACSGGKLPSRFLLEILKH